MREKNAGSILLEALILDLSVGKRVVWLCMFLRDEESHYRSHYLELRCFELKPCSTRGVSGKAYTSTKKVSYEIIHSTAFATRYLDHAHVFTQASIQM